MTKRAYRLTDPKSLTVRRAVPPASSLIGGTPAQDHFAGMTASLGRGRRHWELALITLTLVALFVWVYLPALAELVAIWDREPDYSHGYLVGPIAALFLWFRRDRFPQSRSVPGWGGFALVGLSILLSAIGRLYFLNPLTYWAMIAWIGGVIWILAGRQVFWWALPSVAFLIFMVPLPYRMEGLLSGPLQRIATYLSCWTLQLLGQPAFAEGNTIFLDMAQLEVEHACSGLRMLVMIAALATACAVLVSKNWPERLFLAMCIVPVALFANSVRIVATGLAYQYLSAESSKAMSHDVAGWIVVPVAAITMGLALFYWRRVFVVFERSPLSVSHESLSLRRVIESNKEVP